MIKQDWMEIVAGEKLVDDISAETMARCERNERGYHSEQLVKVQEDQAHRGIVGVELVKSVYGWSVRYDSGLQNFSLLASTRHGQLDGSLGDAVRFAQDWIAQCPSRRYAWRRK